MIIQNIVLSYPLIVEHVRIEQQLAMGQNRGALLFTATKLVLIDAPEPLNMDKHISIQSAQLGHITAL